MLTTPGLGLVFWTTIAFILLVVLLRKFAWKPIVISIHKRNEAIDEALKAAEIARAEMANLQAENEKLLLQAKEDRDAILAKARKIHEKIVEEAGEKAKEEAKRIIQAANENIHFEKMAAITDLKNQLATLSLEIAEKILEKDLAGDAKQKELAEKLVNNVSFN